MSWTEELLLNKDSTASKAILDLSEITSSDDPMLFESLFVEMLVFFPCLSCKFQCNILKVINASRNHYKAFYIDSVQKQRQQSNKSSDKYSLKSSECICQVLGHAWTQILDSNLRTVLQQIIITNHIIIFIYSVPYCNSCSLQLSIYYSSTLF